MGRQRFSGFSLVELMISMTLGLFFIAVAMGSLVDSESTREHRVAANRVLENAQLALEELSRAIRMAGYVDVLAPGAGIPEGPFFTGKCEKFISCTRDGDGVESDQIAVLMNPPPDDGTDADCTGNPVDPDSRVAATSVTAYLYRVVEVEGMQWLTCQTFLVNSEGVATAVNEQPELLVEGIEALQIAYGVTDFKNIRYKDTEISRYASATVVSAIPPPAGGTSSWADIASVRIALLANSALRDYSVEKKERTYTLLDTAVIVRNDQQQRQVVTTTVLVNNVRN